MGRKSKWSDEIEKLVDTGYDPQQIIKRTKLAKSTVYRHVEKLRIWARYRFNNLMSKDYLYQYFNTLDNYARTIQQCNEELNEIPARYDKLEAQIMKALSGLNLPHQALAQSAMLGHMIQIQNSRENAVVRLTGQRDRATDLKAKVYNAGPVVYAIDQWIRDNTPQNAELPRLNVTTTIDKEDEKVLKGMKRDDE